MRGFRLIPALLAWLLLGTAPDPLGTGFQRLDRGRVTRAELPADARRIAIYYGASWCGPCRAFVPELIAAYPRLRAQGVEIVFVSDDATCAAALDYARTGRMPWLLLPCDAARRGYLRRLGGEALPGIVVVDRDGVPIHSSWRPDGSSAPRSIVTKLLAR